MKVWPFGVALRGLQTTAFDLPFFVALSPILEDDGSVNQPSVRGRNIFGWIAYYADGKGNHRVAWAYARATLLSSH
jgi:hypothetical protein